MRRMKNVLETAIIVYVLALLSLVLLLIDVMRCLALKATAHQAAVGF